LKFPNPAKNQNSILSTSMSFFGYFDLNYIIETIFLKTQ